MPRGERTLFQQHLRSAQHALAEGRYVAAREAFQSASKAARIRQAFLELHQALSHAPLEVRREANWLEMSLHSAFCARAANDIELLLTGILDHRWTVYRAWALLQGRHATEALQVLDDSPPDVLPGLQQRLRGEALAQLGDPTWLEAFARARPLLEGRSLGIALNEEGTYRLLAGDFSGAHRLYNEALPLLRHDPYYHAWVKYNLGIAGLHQLNPEAEQHFLEMQRLVQRTEARGLQGRAWTGLAAFRRCFGEWARAETAYETALRLSDEPDDLVQAWRGLGHTRRLAGRFDAALEAFYSARQVSPSLSQNVLVDLAAVYAQRGDTVAAAASLEAITDTLGTQYRERRLVVEAELARRAGRADAALERLRNVQPQTIWIREERECFPALFTLLEIVGDTPPAPLPRTTQTVVEVKALGTLRVMVNARAVPLRATSKVGQLLVRLLETAGCDSIEGLIDALYPNVSADRVSQRKAAQALSALVKELRTALGWTDSVRSTGGAYQLDPASQWFYDASPADLSGRFLEGHYSDWVQEKRQRLEGRALN
jgi:tetratricopeptide (TPR) repeat protein